MQKETLTANALSFSLGYKSFIFLRLMASNPFLNVPCG